MRFFGLMLAVIIFLLIVTAVLAVTGNISSGPPYNQCGYYVPVQTSNGKSTSVSPKWVPIDCPPNVVGATR